MFVCPICAGHLTLAGASLACPGGHTFDVAREGYVNLLTRSIRGEMGDTNEMLRARRAFLDRGFYAPLSDRLNALAVRYRGEDMNAARQTVLDAGCGEGYYLGRLREALDARLGAGQLAYTGVDIAKAAARMAAKRYPGIRFAAADVKRDIPLPDSSVELLLSVFAPRNPDEFARIVAPGGIVLIALPSSRHLIELRKRYGLLGIEPEKERHITAQLAPAFEREKSAALEYAMTLADEDVGHLLLMTPNARHRERQGWREAAPEAARVTASFVVLAFRRHR